MDERNRHFESKIGYDFKSNLLLEEALRASGNTGQGNKRLALVGDSVLSVILLNKWYESGRSTGRLTFFTKMLVD